MVDCPQCGSVVLPAAVVGGVAQCTECEHLFELPAGDPRVAESSTETAEASSAASAAAPGPRIYVPVAPSGAYVTTHDNGLEINLPWRDDVGPLGHLLQIGLAVAFGVMGIQGGSLVAGGALGATAVLLGYSWLYTMVNRTTVLVGPGGVEVSHGPLPSFSFGASYAAAKLLPLSVQTVEKGHGRHRRTVYELHVARTGKAVLGNWNHRETVAFVRDCIVAVLDRSSHHGGLGPGQRSTGRVG